MTNTLLVPLVFLSACITPLPEEREITRNKVPVDVNVVVDLEALAPQDIANETVLLRKKTTFNLNLVRFKDIVVTGKIPSLRVESVSVPDGIELFDFIKELRDSDQYEFVEPNLVRQLDAHILASEEALHSVTQGSIASVNDPYTYLQWHMDTMQVTQMGSAGQGSLITVAVLDTGVSMLGEDTPIHVMEGYDYTENDSDPSDFHGHGTHVSGTIAQATDNNIGVRGVAPDCTIMPVKVLDDDGFGNSHGIANGITYAVDRGANVINMSLVATQSTSIESSAVAYALSNGVTIIASTGNEGETNNVYFPAAYEGVIAVGAVGLDNVITAYSNKGQEMDFAAPGGDFNDDLNGDTYVDGVLQETINGGTFNYYFYEGTSMAAPHASGVYAALMSEGFTEAEITDALINTSIDMGTSGWDKDYGYGVIQLKDAYDYLQSTNIVPPLTLPSLEAHYSSRNNQLSIHHFNSDVISSILCADSLVAEEQRCVELTGNPNQPEQYNSIFGVSSENFYLSLVDTTGNQTNFGPFDINENETVWQDVISCSAQSQLFNLQAGANHEQIQIDFSTSENLRVKLCGNRDNGTSTCQQGWFDGNGSLSLWHAFQNVEIFVRDEQGCSRKIGGLPSFVEVLPER